MEVWNWILNEHLEIDWRSMQSECILLCFNHLFNTDYILTNWCLPISLLAFELLFSEIFFRLNLSKNCIATNGAQWKNKSCVYKTTMCCYILDNKYFVITLFLFAWISKIYQTSHFLCLSNTIHKPYLESNFVLIGYLDLYSNTMPKRISLTLKIIFL